MDNDDGLFFGLVILAAVVGAMIAGAIMFVIGHGQGRDALRSTRRTAAEADSTIQLVTPDVRARVAACRDRDPCLFVDDVDEEVSCYGSYMRQCLGLPALTEKETK